MVVHPQFISKEFQAYLRKYALHLLKNDVLVKNPVSEHRYYLKSYQDSKYATKPIKKLGQKLEQLLDHHDISVDPLLGWVISYIEPGGFVQLHCDNNDYYQSQQRKHLRCNVVVSKEIDSGNPIIEGKTYTVGERDMWGFFASDDRHGCEIVSGNKPRIIYQFGFSVKGLSLEKLRDNLGPKTNPK